MIGGNEGSKERSAGLNILGENVESTEVLLLFELEDPIAEGLNGSNRYGFPPAMVEELLLGGMDEMDGEDMLPCC